MVLQNAWNGKVVIKKKLEELCVCASMPKWLSKSSADIGLAVSLSWM